MAMSRCLPGSSRSKGAVPPPLPVRRAVAILAAGARAPLLAQDLPPEIHYQLTYERAGADHVTVELSWTPPLEAPRALVMPRAIPMGYGEQRYDAFVADVVATSQAGSNDPSARKGRAGSCRRVPRGSRTASTSGAMEREVHSASDASRLREGYLGALGYSVFAFVDGFESRPSGCASPGRPRGRCSAPSRRVGPYAAGMVEASAADFYDLADSQIVMGPRAELRRLLDAPVPLYLAAYVEGPVDLDRLGRLAATAFERVAAYFGTVPFRHYTVHQELLQPLSPRHEYGMSMEHLGSSTYYLLASAGITAPSTPQDDARVLYNFAHHMAHAWVPKRASGAGYFPFQWELAPVLDSIWFAEGFGQYAAIVAVADGDVDPAGVPRADMLARRFRSNSASAPAVPPEADARGVEPRRLDPLLGGLPHRPARVLARRADGGRARRAHPGTHREASQPARRPSLSRRLGRARAAGLRDRRAGRPHRPGHRRRHARRHRHVAAAARDGPVSAVLRAPGRPSRRHPGTTPRGRLTGGARAT